MGIEQTIYRDSHWLHRKIKLLIWY